MALGSFDGKGNSRNSLSIGSASAFAAVKNLMNKEVDRPRYIGQCFTVQQELKQAVFDFALSGNPVVFFSSPMRLIEIGVASVTLGGDGAPDANLEGVLDEPLIVQAGIKCCSLSVAVKERLAAQGRPGCLV
jgi:hypothetical protein